MEYIPELCKLLGHRPLMMVGTATLIVDADQRFLMMKRSDNGSWGLPGIFLQTLIRSLSHCL